MNDRTIRHAHEWTGAVPGVDIVSRREAERIRRADDAMSASVSDRETVPGVMTLGTPSVASEDESADTACL